VNKQSLIRICQEVPQTLDSFASSFSLDKFLEYERAAYALVKEAGDIPESYNAFFRAVESSSLKFFYGSPKINIYLEKCTRSPRFVKIVDDLVRFLDLSENLVLQIGPTTLANGLLLRSALSKLDTPDKQRTRLILLDCDLDLARTVQSETQVHSAGLGSLPASLRFLSIVQALRISAGKSSPSSICFWSLPLGLTFFYSLIRSFPTLDYIRLSQSSTKYAYCFSSLIVDSHISGPNQEYYPRKDSCISLPSFAYSDNDLSSVAPFEGSREWQLLAMFDELHRKNMVLMSSLARHEKTSACHFLDFLSDALKQNPRLVYLRCGTKSLTKPEIDLCKRYPGRFIDIGWNNLQNLIKSIDIYIDPWPAGGGYSLLLALKNHIACVIPDLSDPDSLSTPSPRYYLRQSGYSSKLDKTIVDLIFPQELAQVQLAISRLVDNTSLMQENQRVCEGLYATIRATEDKPSFVRYIST